MTLKHLQASPTLVVSAFTFIFVAEYGMYFFLQVDSPGFAAFNVCSYIKKIHYPEGLEYVK